MRVFTAVVEKCSETGLYVGYVPGFTGAHSQGETLDELGKNLMEVIEMLLDTGGSGAGFWKKTGRSGMRRSRRIRGTAGLISS
ncbi:MAG: type II toxin-antitoxin system HicB family antitoxin [Candidatus Latescibacter sp.]|nr:type II toxin-antitoxin system HicB family antitoxin [Candidatus Latescibacter sp.]